MVEEKYVHASIPQDFQGLFSFIDVYLAVLKSSIARTWLKYILAPAVCSESQSKKRQSSMCQGMICRLDQSVVAGRLLRLLLSPVISQAL